MYSTYQCHPNETSLCHCSQKKMLKSFCQCNSQCTLLLLPDVNYSNSLDDSWIAEGCPFYACHKYISKVQIWILVYVGLIERDWIGFRFTLLLMKKKNHFPPRSVLGILLQFTDSHMHPKICHFKAMIDNMDSYSGPYFIWGCQPFGLGLFCFASVPFHASFLFFLLLAISYWLCYLCQKDGPKLWNRWGLC